MSLLSTWSPGKPGLFVYTIMAREFAKQFYGSTAWQQCRDTYRQKAAGLCEDCRKRGIINAGDEVHHVIWLTPQNINDPNITLNFDNLVLLCHECHMKRHGNSKRYRILPDGSIKIKEDTPPMTV